MNNGFTPEFKIKLPKADKKIKETYTDEELKKLLKKPNIKRCEFNEYKTWVFSNYLLATGNCISTVLNLQIRDLDFDNGIIQLNKMKNRKAQIVPMASSLAVILKEFLKYRWRHVFFIKVLITPYAMLLQYIEENEYEICGNIRESYIDGVWNKETENEWLTEIQIPAK